MVEHREISDEELLQAPDFSTTFVPKLEAQSHLDTVGSAGGLRVYIPARMARDSQFPFEPDEKIVIRVFVEDGKPAGLVLKSRERVGSITIREPSARRASTLEQEDLIKRLVARALRDYDRATK